MADLVAVMVNPKNGRAVEVLSVSTRITCIRHLGSTDEIGCSSFEDISNGLRGEYVRIHTPGGVHPRGQGYGLLLYAGSALAAGYLAKDGVFSIVGNRSSSAEDIWEKMVEKGLAERTETEVEGAESEPVEQEHCVPIADRYRETDDGYIISDEVCGTVMIEKSGGGIAEVTYIDAATVLGEQLVLWYAKDEGEAEEVDPDERAPVDLAVRIKVTTREEAQRIAQILRESYGEEAVEMFMQRHDVLELYGQQRLLGQFAARPRVAFPAVSRKAQGIVAKWSNVPDGGKE